MSAGARRALLTLCASAALAGCASEGPAALAVAVVDLDQARARWEARGPDRYRYTLTRQCFCVEDATGPAVVRVEDGVVTSVGRPGTGRPLPEPRLFPSVDGLFDLLEDAVERGADRVDVTYDTSLGVPVRIFIDYEAAMADEEVGFEATLPEPLD